LAGVPLDQDELAWLLAVDPRALRTDPLRRARGLHALLEEYPASAMLAAAALGGVQGLEQFFSPPQLQVAIQQRGSMALAFGLYLRELKPPDARLVAIATLEGAMAELRRAFVPARSGLSRTPKQLVLAPHLRCLDLPGGTLSLYQALLSRLAKFGKDPVEALLHPKLRLRSTPTLRHAEAQSLLVSRDGPDAMGLEEIPAGLASLLRLAAVPRSLAELLEDIRREGAEPGEDQEILENVLRDGWLVEL
jgi:hypothetical protein